MYSQKLENENKIPKFRPTLKQEQLEFTMKISWDRKRNAGTWEERSETVSVIYFSVFFSGPDSHSSTHPPFERLSLGS